MEVFPRPRGYVYSRINELFPALGEPEPETVRDLQSDTRKGGDRAQGRLTCTCPAHLYLPAPRKSSGVFCKMQMEHREVN